MNLLTIRLAFRNLKRNKLYSFLSISGFAIGFAVCLIIALHVYNELNINHCFPNIDRIVRVIDVKENLCSLDKDLQPVFKQKLPEAEQACTMELTNGYDISIKSGNKFLLSKGVIGTTDDFFNVFPLKRITSTGSLLFAGRNSIVLTKSLADKLFPGGDAIGKPITIFDNMTGQVTAVVDDFPKSSSIQADVFTNADNPDYRLNQNCTDGKCWNPTNHFLLLRKGVNQASLVKSLNHIIQEKDFDVKEFGIQPFSQIYLAPDIDGNSIALGNKSLLWILISIGGLVLLLSTINYLNFNISLLFTKIREVGIKRIYGAQLRQLLGSSLAEVSISLVLSIVLAIALIQLLLPFANTLFNNQLVTSQLLNPKLFIIFLFLVFIIALINSLLPMLIILRVHTNNTILLKSKITGVRQTGRKIMTFFQFAISILLISLTFAIYKQLNYVKHADLGFQKENLLRINFPETFQQQSVLREKLNKLDFLENFSFSSGVPGNIQLGLSEFINHKSINVQCMKVDDNFIQTLGIRLKKGRTFQPGDMGTTCLINAEGLKQFGWKSITNQRFNQGREGGYEVIGVTDNFFVESMHKTITPVCLLAAPSNDAKNLRQLTIRLKKGNLSNQISQLTTVWNSLIPDEPINYTFYDEQFNAMYQKEERFSKAIAVAAIFALILTFMGILGQAFQISLNRTKEIGIRKVNGATVLEILLYLNKEFLGWLLASFVIAVPVAWYLIHKWLENFAYKTALNCWLFILAGIIVSITVTITISVQSWKTASRNPVDALRYE